MKLLNRVREKFKHKNRLTHRKSSHPTNLDRRHFIRATAAIALAQLIPSCITPIAKETQAISTRYPFSAKQAFEQTPGIAKSEKAFVKLKGMPGKIFALEGFETPTGVSIAIPKGVQSVIHSHPSSSNFPEPERTYSKRAANIPSDNDLGKTVHDPYKNHIPCISEEGKVIGYISINLRKKTAKDVPAIKLLLKKLQQVGRNIEAEWTQGSFNLMDQSLLEFHGILETMKFLGLQLRMKAMPGYEYKEGYFQKKN